jgi:hypothetical protein
VPQLSISPTVLPRNADLNRKKHLRVATRVSRHAVAHSRVTGEDSYRLGSTISPNFALAG